MPLKKPRSKTSIPKAVGHRMIYAAGAKRSSDEADSALCKLLDKHGEKISQIAHQIAANAKRRTVSREDVLAAARQVKS